MPEQMIEKKPEVQLITQYNFVGPPQTVQLYTGHNEKVTEGDIVIGHRWRPGKNVRFVDGLYSTTDPKEAQLIRELPRYKRHANDSGEIWEIDPTEVEQHPLGMPFFGPKPKLQTQLKPEGTKGPATPAGRPAPASSVAPVRMTTGK